MVIIQAILWPVFDNLSIIKTTLRKSIEC